jgi:hypothetical protein
MDPRLKSQDTVFEVLEKGNFIAPPGGDDLDLEEIPVLRRAMVLLFPGTVLALLLPGIFGGTLLPFLGALVLIFGYLRLREQSPWIKAAAALSSLQAFLLAFCFVAETTMAQWQSLPVYRSFLIAAPVLAALTPCLLTLGLRSHRSYPAPAAILALCGIALTVLQLTNLLLAVRIGLAVVGAAMLAWLLLVSLIIQPVLTE